MEPRNSNQLSILLVRVRSFLVSIKATRRVAIEDRTDPWRGEACGGTLPIPSTPLVDREEEVDNLCRSLLRPEVRLLTLTGAPGIGKTRVAIAAAARLLDTFEHGLLFVDLSSVRDPARVLPAVAQALQLKGRGRRPLAEVIVHALRGKAALVVFDNCEQVIAAAPQVGSLLARCPHLKFLVTSRARLHLSWEHELSLSPLKLPDPEFLPPVDVLAVCPAVALFVERARAVKPDFALTTQNARTVASICHRLDGLPLALELAAARIKLLPPQAMLERLHPRLALLAGGGQDLPRRHQTVRSAIEWSYDLLEANSQIVFRRLSVFSGCTLEAAEAVCARDREDSANLLDALASLIDNSLLRQETHLDGEARFSMLETIREYGLERLAASGEEETIRAHHGRYYAKLAEAAERELRGREQGAWLERLERENDNLRAALRWALGAGDTETGLQMAAGLAAFWERHGYSAEGRAWLDVLLSASGETAPGVRAKALNVAGNLARVEGDYTAAVKWHREALSLRRTMDDRRGIAASVNNLGVDAKDQGDYATARTFFEESLSIKRELDEPRGVALTLSNLALTAKALGDHASAGAFLEESLKTFRELGDKWGVALALNNLGTLALLRGDIDRATALHRSSLALRRELNDKWGIAECLEGLARVGAKLGETEDAAKLSGAADVLREILGFPLPPDERADYERHLSALRSHLSDQAFADAWEAGRLLSPEEAIDFALSVHPPHPAPNLGQPLVKIHLFGDFRLIAAGEEIPHVRWGRPQAKAILQYLLLHRQRYVSAEELVEVFWPDVGRVEETALYTALSRIRKGLQGLPGSPPIRLIREQVGYRLLPPPGTWIDVEAFTEGLRQARACLPKRAKEAAVHLARALVLYEGDLLRDPAYSEWCATEREALRLQFVEGKCLLARLYEGAERYGESLAVYAQILEVDPSFEEAHRGLMRCYALTDRRELALRQYIACREILRKDLEVEPSKETEVLHEHIRQGTRLQTPSGPAVN